jgi:hypothetical protein
VFRLEDSAYLRYYGDLKRVSSTLGFIGLIKS